MTYTIKRFKSFSGFEDAEKINIDIYKWMNNGYEPKAWGKIVYVENGSIYIEPFSKSVLKDIHYFK